MKPTSAPHDHSLFHEHSILAEPRNFWQRAVQWFTDWSSPIVVKEYRQAIKSRQFVWTFMLLLLAVLIWSLGTVALAIGNDYSTAGIHVLNGYLWILAFPAIVIVPFTAFRSLAREYEDETIQLVGITTMKPRQLVTGKLLSALLQLTIYLAAVGPCIAFSYLLRGIDLVQIASSLVYLMSVAVAATCLGLMCGGLGKNAFLRLAINLFLIIGLLFLYIFMTGLLTALMFRPRYGSEINPDLVMAIVATVSCAFAYLFFEAAGAQVSFPASNRSSRVRVGTVVVQSAIAAVMASIYFGNLNEFYAQIDREMMLLFCATTMLATHLWVVVGSMMAAESGVISDRVRRALPRTLWGRTWLSLFFPGPGRGLLFSITQILVWPVAIIGVWMAWALIMQPPWLPVWQTSLWELATVFEFYAINSILGVGYLSGTYLLCHWLRRRLGRTMLPLYGLVIVLILYAVVNTGAFLTSAVLNSMSGASDSIDEMAPMIVVWPVLMEKIDRQMSIIANMRQPGLALAVLSFPLILSIAAIGIAARELNLRWLPTPQRVLAEPKHVSTAKSEVESFEDILAERARE